MYMMFSNAEIPSVLTRAANSVSYVTNIVPRSINIDCYEQS
jgi:hypothetical protein